MPERVIPYVTAWRWQKALSRRAIDAQRAGISHPDSLISLQHHSIYTLGRGSTLSNLRFDPFSQTNHAILRVERGGEVTWHGPGQLTVYPIIDLTQNKRQDLHWYWSELESSVIDVLGTIGIHATRDAAGTGVWVGGAKIAAVGLSVSRWVTMHGISLNVSADLTNFDNIVPCGILNRRVTSIQDELRKIKPDSQADISAINQLLLQALSRAFNLELSVSLSDPALDAEDDHQLGDSEWLERHHRPLLLR